MKRFIKILCILFIVVLLTGCESYKESDKTDRLGITSAMKKKNIISNDYKQIDVQRKCSWSLEWCSCSNMYIFEDSNSNIIGIEYTDISDDKENKYEHQVLIHYNLIKNNNISYLEETEINCSSENGYYQYEDNKYTDKPKYEYEYSNYKLYIVNEIRILPFLRSKYILSEA